MSKKPERSPPRTAREVYQRLEKANILDKIPDRLDPNIIFSEDDDSDTEEAHSQTSEFYADVSQEDKSLDSDYDCSNLQLSYEDRVNKYNNVYEGFMKRISNLKCTPNVDCAPSFPDSHGNHIKIDNSSSGSMLMTNTPQSIEWLVPSRQHSANSSVSSIEIAMQRESLCGLTGKTDRLNESSKIVWKGPNFSKTEPATIMQKQISFLENTPMTARIPVQKGSRPVVYAPKKEHPVWPVRYDWLENVPQMSKLNSCASQEKTKFSNNLKIQQPELSVPIQETATKIDAACSPIQRKPEYKEYLQVNSKEFHVLSQLGVGGSCKVYAAFDKETETVVAIKHVNLAYADASLKEGFVKEVEYLKVLQNSKHVIKLLDYEFRREEILLVMEKGDTDLAYFLTDVKRMKSLTPLMIKFYWSQMLQAVWEIHEFGIIHSDLKPANFLLVSGHLKLIDFGISTSVPIDMTSAIRNSQVGTINYMSPEAVTNHGVTLDEKKFGFKVGVKTDVWSLGCILYNLVYGHTPFQMFHFIAQKIEALTNPEYPIAFPPISDPALLDVLKRCLERNPKERASISDLLNHPYLKAERPVSEPDEHIKELITKITSLSPAQQSIVIEMVDKLLLT